MAATTTHLPRIILVLVLLYFPSCKAGRDASGPIILLDDGSEDEVVEQRDIREMLKRVDDNLGNVIQHVERLYGVIDKLDTKLDSLQSRVNEIQNTQLNCSTTSQVKRWEANVALSLDDLDRRMDQIEKQMKLSSASSIRATIEDVNERARDIQRKVESIQIDSSPSDVIHRLDAMNGKLMDIQYDCKRKDDDGYDNFQVGDRLARMETLMQNKTVVGSSTADAILMQSQVLMKMDSMLEGNTDVLGNLINSVENIGSHCNTRHGHDGAKNINLGKLERQIEDVSVKLNSFPKSIGANISKLVKEELGKMRGSHHECSLIIPHLTQMSESVMYKFDQLKDACQSDADFLVSSVGSFKDKNNHNHLNEEIMVEKLTSIDEKTTMTQEKLNYMTGTLTLLQMDQSDVGVNLQKLNSKVTDVHAESQVIKEYLENSTSIDSKPVQVDQSEIIRLLMKLDDKMSHTMTSQITPVLHPQAPPPQTQNVVVEDVYSRVVTLSSQLTKISSSIDKLSRDSTQSRPCQEPGMQSRMEQLLEQNAINLQDMKETIIHHAFEKPPTTEHEPLLRAISHTLDSVSSKLNSLTTESVDRLTRLLEDNQKTSFLPDVTMSTVIYTIYHQLTTNNETTFKLLKAMQDDIKILLVQLHPLMDLPTQLYNITLNSQTTSKTSSTSDIDAFFWSRTSHVLDTVAELQERMEDKFTKLKSSLQTTVDHGMVEIVDILGQNKAWLENTATAFVNRHTDNLVQVKESMTSLVAKGFENLHFMYQYLNGKLDKIHHIAAHNMEDCSDIQHSGHTTSGVYTIYPRNSKEMRVYCDMDSEEGGWTVLQRRDTRSAHPRISFNRTWVDYKYGFGNLEDEFWLGNEHIHVLTHQNNYVLRIDMAYAEPDPRLPRYKRKFWHNLSNESKPLHAQYSHFRLRSEHHNYTLLYGRYMGIHPYDGLDGKKNTPFITWDHAPDINLGHCAKLQGGGWWYGNECFRYALNSKAKKYYWEDGSIYTGITWGGTADVALLKSTEMKILPLNVYQRTVSQGIDNGA